MGSIHLPKRRLIFFRRTQSKGLGTHSLVKMRWKRQEQRSLKKPSSCDGCAYLKGSSGYCADWTPSNPKLAIILRAASKDEVINGEMMSGKAGRYWFYEFFTKAGFDRKDVLISKVLRCNPNIGVFPIGAEKKKAVEACKRYDGPIQQFNPDIFIVSFSPVDLMKSPAQVKFIRRVIEKVKGFIAEGRRPAILFGIEAREKYAPWLAGQMKKFQGHYWEVA